MVEIIVNKADILRLINALAVFIKQKQAKIKKIENVGNKQCKKADLS